MISWQRLLTSVSCVVFQTVKLQFLLHLVELTDICHQNRNGDRLTTKSNVYSFGVVLMELITAQKALDHDKPVDDMHLATWFRRNRLHVERLPLIIDIDPEIQKDEKTVDSIEIVAKLAGDCCRWIESERPNMHHVVTVLSSLLEEWNPTNDREEGASTVSSGGVSQEYVKEAEKELHDARILVACI